jgi:hypothetical protein
VVSRLDDRDPGLAAAIALGDQILTAAQLTPGSA